MSSKLGGVLMAASVIIVLVIVCITLFQVQKAALYKNDDLCDEKYGVGNWNYEDITGTPEADEMVGRFYLGQVWRCYPK